LRSFVVLRRFRASRSTAPATQDDRESITLRAMKDDTLSKVSDLKDRLQSVRSYL